MIGVAQSGQEPGRRFLHARQRRAHTGADVERDYHLERDVLGLEARDLLRPVVVEDREVVGLEPFHESTVAVGDDGGELHDVDVDRFGDLEALGVDGCCRSSALDVLGRHADRVLDDLVTGVPVALKRLTR